MKKCYKALGCIMVAAIVSAAPLRGYAEEAAAPAPDAVLTELAKIGPDALVSHVQQLKDKIGKLKADAEAARQQAASLEAQSADVQKRVQTIEQFVANLSAAMNPPAEEKPAEAPPAEEQKAEAAAEPAPAEAMAEAAPAEAPPAEATAEAAPAEAAPAEAAPAEGAA